MTDFLKNGTLTEDGQKVVDTLNQWVTEALKDPNPDKFNSMGGHVKHYGTNVIMLKSIKPTDWIAEHNTAAEAVMDVLNEAAQKQKVTEAATRANEGVTKLTEELGKLQKIVEQQAAELKELKEAKATEKPADKKAKKDKTEETDSEA